jgi:hypothetical protein
MADASIDYKKLLIHYIAFIGDREGMSHLVGEYQYASNGIEQYFTEKEYEEMQRLDKLANDVYEHLTKAE